MLREVMNELKRIGRTGAVLLLVSAAYGHAQTVTAPSPGMANVIPIFSGGLTLADSTITETNGLVGIGTSSPIAPLTLVGIGSSRVGFPAVADFSGSTTERARLGIGNTGGGTSHSSALIFYSGTQPTYEFGTDFYYNGTQSFYIWDGQTNQIPWFIDSSDNVGVGTLTPAAKLEVNGNVISDGTLTVKGQGGITFSDGTVQSTAFTGVVCGGDYAESVDVTGDRTHYEPGDLMVIDPNAEGKFLKSAEAYSTFVTGIYSTKPGVIGRRQLTDRSNMKEEVPMAMTGIVPTKVTAENGAIKPGDLLVTSSKLGYAMKGTDRSKMLGAVIGKALGHLDSGTGVIEVVVTLQ